MLLTSLLYRLMMAKHTSSQHWRVRLRSRCRTCHNAFNPQLGLRIRLCLGPAGAHPVIDTNRLAFQAVDVNIGVACLLHHAWAIERRTLGQNGGMLDMRADAVSHLSSCEFQKRSAQAIAGEKQVCIASGATSMAGSVAITCAESMTRCPVRHLHIAHCTAIILKHQHAATADAAYFTRDSIHRCLCTRGR